MALIKKVNPELPEDAPLILAAEVIRAGGIVVYPTETLYGIGGNALDARAIIRVRKVKKRKDHKPILIIVPTIEELKPLVTSVPPVAERLMRAFWPGPLTLIFRASGAVPQELMEGGGTIGIRVPSSPLCLKLLLLAGVPITSTSANLSGVKPHRSISQIKAALASGVDLYLDGGTLPENKPSTVLDVSHGSPTIVREGAVSREQIRKLIPHIC